MKTPFLVISFASLVVASHGSAVMAQPADPDAATESEASEVAEPEVSAEPEEPAAPAVEADASEPTGSSAAAASAEASYEPLAAEGDDFLLAIAPRLGLVIPTSKLGLMVAAGIELDYRLPFASGLFVAADFSFTRPAHDGTVMDPRMTNGTLFELHDTEYKVALDAVYRHSLSETLVVVGGAGPVVQILRTNETTSLAPGTNTATDTYFGFELLGGLDYRVGPGFVLGEIRGIYTDLNDLLAGNSNGGNVLLSVGYRLTL